MAEKWASGNSHACKHMTQIRDKVKENMIWNINEGNNIFWWDNWPGKGPLAKLFPNGRKSENTNVKQFIQEGSWNMNKLINTLNEQFALHIIAIEIGDQSQEDYTLWDAFANG